MTEFKTPLEGGNGVAVGQSNHGGTAFSSAPTGTPVFTTDFKAHGTSAVQASSSSTMSWNTVNQNGPLLMRGCMYINPPASGQTLTITGDTTVAQSWWASGTRAGQLIVNSLQRFRLQTYGSGGVQTRWSGTITLPHSTWLRYQFWTDPGQSVTTGAVRMAWWSAMDSTGNPTEDSLGAANTAGIDTAGTSGILTQGRFTIGSTFKVDDLAMRDAPDSAWVAWPAVTPEPSGTATTSDTFAADFRSFVPGTAGNALTFNIAWVSGPNNVAQVTEPVEGLFLIPKGASPSVYTVNVVEAGQSYPKTVNVPALAPVAPVADSILRRKMTASGWM
jgi:hypothetical protein